MTKRNQTKRSQKAYTPEQRAAVLALLTGGAAVKRVSRETKIPESTVRWWRDNPAGAASVEMREQAEKDLGSELDRLRRLYVTRAGEPAAVASTSGYYAVRAVSDLTTAFQLVTGGATQRIDATPWGVLMSELRDARQKAQTPVALQPQATHKERAN